MRICANCHLLIHKGLDPQEEHEMRECSKCNEEVPVEAFVEHHGEGVEKVCKRCHRLIHHLQDDRDVGAISADKKYAENIGDYLDMDKETVRRAYEKSKKKYEDMKWECPICGWKGNWYAFEKHHGG